MKTQQKIIVTGAAGFIGYHLCCALLRSGVDHLIALDDLRCGTWSGFPAEAECVQQDFAAMDEESLCKLLEGADVLYHLAAEKYNSARLRPESILNVNINGTYKLLNAAQKAGVKRVVFASSLYAHGGIALPPMKESDNPTPWTVYGISKLAGERLLDHFGRSGGFDWCALRLFFVYGPRQFTGSGYKSVIVSNFERLLRQEAPTIRGSGEQVLDYVYVDDVVEAFMVAGSGQWSKDILNIGTGQGISINALTQNMLKIADSSLSPVSAEADWTDGTVRVPDMHKTFSKNLWRPKVHLQEGLRNVYSWMKING